MGVRVEVQYTCINDDLPGPAAFRHWVQGAAAEPDSDVEVVVRVVDRAESAELNAQYRHQMGPTNVLSFPFEPPPETESKLLGDLIICGPVVAEEAREQGKSVSAHWAHMVVHGMLHLRGYDHDTPEAAAQMETLEISIMAKLGFPDPYE